MIWKRKERQETAMKGKPITELIEEIHDTFYTEVDKLLAEAKIMKSAETQKSELIDKMNALKKLGFANTKECEEADEEVLRLSKIEAENNSKQEMVDAINYFSHKYPLYKFITEESVKKICKKYGLVYSDVINYIGIVPNKNLADMQQFNIDENDECYFVAKYRESIDWSLRLDNIRYFDIHKFKKNRDGRGSYYRRVDKGLCPFEIAAPISDFNTDNMELEDFKLTKKLKIPDPVVLKPVFYKGKKHYLIVTAWGDEASDPLVVNEINN
jgi:hypothetical protein